MAGRVLMAVMLIEIRVAAAFITGSCRLHGVALRPAASGASTAAVTAGSFHMSSASLRWTPHYRWACGGARGRGTLIGRQLSAGTDPESPFPKYLDMEGPLPDRAYSGAGAPQAANAEDSIGLKAEAGTQSDSADAGGTAAVRIVSYNVLSSSLCEADYHVKCAPGDLDEKARLRRVCALLAPEMDNSAVICLQEVSTKWAGALHAQLSRKNYHMIYMGYGGKFDGYMGCALAFPAGKYTLEDCKMERVADLKRWPRLTRPGRRQRFRMWAQSLWRRWKGVKPPIDPYADTKKRANQLLYARLRDNAVDTTFCVATYHMPCQFRVPEVMVSHAALALRHLQLLARADPLIFCGDFNFKPGDSPYRLVTEGNLLKDDEHYPTLPPEDKWVPHVEYPMRSAYKEGAGAEPAYTNWAFTRGSQEDFIDCLDYIFLSEGIDVTGVLELPTKDSCPGPYPSATQPSDHVMIAANLCVSHQGNAAGAAIQHHKRSRGGYTRAALKSEDVVADTFRQGIQEFAADEKRSKMEFPTSLNSFERLVVHRLAGQAGLESGSVGVGRDRRITVWKK